MPHHRIFFLQHPVQRVEIGPGVIAEVLHQILLRLALVMLVPARVQNQDVAFANSASALSIISGVITAQSCMCFEMSTTTPRLTR